MALSTSVPLHMALLVPWVDVAVLDEMAIVMATTVMVRAGETAFSPSPSMYLIRSSPRAMCRPGTTIRAFQLMLQRRT